MKAFAAMVLILVAARIAVCATSDPIPFNDTWDYWNNARFIRDLNFTHYDGVRTPVYPLLVLACRLDGNLVRAVQFVLGIGVASMLFWLVYRGARSWQAALFAGLIYGLGLRPLVFESTLLSETLCTFLLMLSVSIFGRMVFDGRVGRLHHSLLGAAAALTILCRPMYLFLAPLFFVLLLIEDRRREVDSGEIAKRLALFAAFSAIPLLGWCAFNLKTVGYFGLSTQLGFDLADHCAAFIELAPARYAAIRDRIIVARDGLVAATGSSEYAVFRALWKPAPAYYVPMSRELAKMAFEMIAAHPILYAETVGHSLRGFWTGIPAQRPVTFRDPALASWIWAAWRVEQTLLPALNAVFFIFVALAMSRLIHRERPPRLALATMAIVLATSVLSSMVEYEENSRMYTPTYPLILYAVMVSAWSYIPSTACARKWKWPAVPVVIFALVSLVAGYHAWEHSFDAPAIEAADGWLKSIDECVSEKCWAPPNDRDERSRGLAGAVSASRKIAGPLKSRRLKLARYDTELTFRPPGRYVYVEYDSDFEALGPAQETILATVGKDGQWRLADYILTPPNQYFSGGISVPRNW